MLDLVGLPGLGQRGLPGVVAHHVGDGALEGGGDRAVEAVVASRLGRNTTPSGVVIDSGTETSTVQQAHPGGVDVVIHLAGDPATLLPAVRTGGRFISTLIGSPEQLPTEEATVIGIYANPDTATLNRAAAHQVDGVTRLQVQDTFPLDKAPAALAAFTGGTLGKLVITTT